MERGMLDAWRELSITVSAPREASLIGRTRLRKQDDKSTSRRAWKVEGKNKEADDARWKMEDFRLLYGVWALY